MALLAVITRLQPTLSACTLFWLGKLADSVSVPRLSLTMGAVCLAAMHFSTVSGVASLCFGIYLLRLSGQGMMFHVYSTAMGRRYQAARGRALAFSGFGMNIGEAIFPVLVILALGFIDWRLIWLILPVLAFASFAPVIPALCQRTKYQDGPGRDGPVSDSAITRIDDSAQTDMPEIRRYQVKGDIIFWAVIIWLMMIPGFVITRAVFPDSYCPAKRGAAMGMVGKLYLVCDCGDWRGGAIRHHDRRIQRP